MENKKVAVIGAGPVGSTLAIILAQKGYEVDLFEKREDPTLKSFQEEGRSFNLSVSVRALNGWRRANVEKDIIKSMVPMYKRCVHMPDDSTHYYPYGKEQDHVLSIRRRYIQEILTKKIKSCQNIKTYFQTQVTNVDLKQTTFDAVLPDGSIQQKKYSQVIGADGAFSVIQKAFQQTLDFNYSIDYGDYGYLELDIPPDESGNYRHNPQAFHFWPRKKIMLAGLPNIENNFTIGLFMRMKGPNSFEEFKDPEQFETYMHSIFKNTRYLMPKMKEDFSKNPVARIIIIKTYPWSKGNFLLIGDSAHAMTPFYGQGLNSGLEDCVVLEQMIDKYHGHWPTINQKFQEVRKPQADAISQLSSQLFNIMREADVAEGYLLARGLTTYLTESYQNMFRTQQELVYLSHVDFTKCLSYGKVEAQILKEVLQTVPEIKQLMRTGQRDARIEKILQKYYGIYEIPEEQKLNDLEIILRQRVLEEQASQKVTYIRPKPFKQRAFGFSTIQKPNSLAVTPNRQISYYQMGQRALKYFKLFK